MLTSRYRTSAFNEISKTLGDLFNSLDTPLDVSMTQSSISNFIICESASSEKAIKDASRLAEDLSAFYPGRFFVVGTRRQSGISVEVAVTCRQISKNEQICSEIVRICSDSKSIAAVPSLLKASLLTGVPTELLIGSSGPSSYIKMFYPIADLIIIDSELCWDDLSAMEELQVRSNMLVDLQWIGLSPWREQLKSVFDRPAVKNSLKQGRGAALFDIQIKCGASEIAEPLLLAGWILTRLKLEPTGFGVGVFECIAQDGGIARLKISRTAEKKSAIPGVQSLTIFLRESSADIQPDDLRISIRRTGELLETEIHAGDIHKMSASLESQDLVEKLRRFFLIGESTANYPATLKAAIDLSRLRQGYGDF